MLDLAANEDLIGVAARIQALTVVVGDAAVLKGNHLPSTVRVRISHGAPQSDANADMALVADGQSTLVADLAVTHIDRADGADVEDHTNNVDSFSLKNAFNLIKTGKSKADALNFLVLSAWLHNGILAKGQAMIVWDRSEALVSKFDHTVGECVDALLLEH